jgi:hypothetical protein
MYLAIEGHEPGRYSDAEINTLLSYTNDAPAAYMFLARDLLTLQGYHFPPLIYLDSHRPEQLTEDTEEDASSPDVMVLDKEVIVYPNPAQNEINVIWQIVDSNVDFVDFELFNILGTRVGFQTEKINSGSILYKANHLPSGLYFYKFTTGIGKIYTGSIQIQH